VRGTVAHVVWAYPHTYLSVASSSWKGERWIIESESPGALKRLGWAETSIRPGDHIWSVGAGSRDGARVMRCQFVAVPTGTRLPCYPSGAAVMRGTRSART
jgi:Family of unknown function (DUF6152)